MQSTARDVIAYLEEVPADRKPALAKLRDLCRATLTDFRESMTYGMPSYSRHGQVEIAFASQKNYIALYILKNDVMDSHRDLLQGKGVRLSKGCIRYSRPERIDFQVVERILKAARESTGIICG